MSAVPSEVAGPDAAAVLRAGRRLALGSVECQRAWAATGTPTTTGQRPAWRAVVIDDRRLAVLRAIVEDYVATQEPVGSRALVERHSLGVSPGDDPQRHGGAGGGGLHRASRTPAPAACPPTRATGCSSTSSPPSSRCRAPERRAIGSFLDGAVDLDDVVGRTVRLLAQLTRQVALVQYPSLSRSLGAPRRAGVRSTPTRLLLVLIADTGRVEQRLVDLPVRCPTSLLSRPARAAQRPRRTASGWPTSPRRSRTWPRRSGRPSAPPSPRSWRPCSRRSSSGARSAWCSPAPPTSPRSGRTSPAACARCSRRSRSRWCCSACSARRRGPDATADGAHRPREPGRGPRRRPPSCHRRLRRGTADPLARLGIVGPTRMDYPGDDGARSRAVARYLGRVLAEQ